MSEVLESTTAPALHETELKQNAEGGKNFNWFTLPGEIRDQIYETLVPFEVNFVYHSPWIFPDYNHSYKAMKKHPGGLTFEFSPFPEPAIAYYSQISSRFGAELSDCIDRQRHRVLRALEDCTSGTAAWNTDFDSEKVTPKLLELVARSRFVFASFGHTTQNIIKKLDKRIKNNIHDIFITQSMISSIMPGNMGKWTYPPRSTFGKMFRENFPNLEKVALEVQHSRRDGDCIREVMDWFDEEEIKQLEIIYPRKQRDAGGRVWAWLWNDCKYKEEPTIEDCYELLWDFTFQEDDRGPEWRWKAQVVDEDEVNERGRFFANCQYPYADREKTMVEGTVFRLLRETPVYEKSSVEENLELMRALEQMLDSGFDKEDPQEW
ncbi:hypothetical protein TWF730_007271 [Orbilia blumenaviensis]|uniref:Uncharacterized protein n=1 Tax=Orbilia blumenaviensis TaxID=1796055 RepID=A0AAV9VA21_9PEZI